MDGIGPKENRPKMVNNNWGGTIEDNSFGTQDVYKRQFQDRILETQRRVHLQNQHHPWRHPGDRNWLSQPDVYKRQLPEWANHKEDLPNGTICIRRFWQAERA